jgi:hypothetical protein
MHDAGEAQAGGLSLCLQDFVSLVWSGITGFFSWIASWFTSPGYTDPELLANPLKQIQEDLAPWQGMYSYALEPLVATMQETCESSTASWALHLEVYRGGRLQFQHIQEFRGRSEKLGTHPSCKNDNLGVYERGWTEFLKDAQTGFANEQRYIDLKHDGVILKLMGAVADPNTYSKDALTYKNNFACVIQTWGESAALDAYKRNYNYEKLRGSLAIRKEQGLAQDLRLNKEPVQ